MTDTVIIDSGPPAETGYRFSWGLAIAGGVVAAGVTFFLLALGAGFGLMLVGPASNEGPSWPVFLTAGAIYFLAAQAFGFGVGGHLAGRLMGPIAETDREETFRAAAHGLVAWAVAVLATATMLALGGMAASAAGAGAVYGASQANEEKADEASPSAYLVDRLFRPGENATAMTVPPAPPGEAREEAGRIVDTGLANGRLVDPADRTRLVQLVSAAAGVPGDQAVARVDALDGETQATIKQAADIARKAASYASLWTALALLFGALVAAGAAVLARREEYEFIARREAVLVR